MAEIIVRNLQRFKLVENLKIVPGVRDLNHFFFFFFFFFLFYGWL